MTKPNPGETWKPTTSGTQKRCVLQSPVLSDTNVRYKLIPSGLIKSTPLDLWENWVTRFKCEIVGK